MPLKVSLGQATRLGGRASNEDYAVYALPEGKPGAFPIPSSG